MVILVNGKRCEVWRVIDDGADHALVTLSRDCPQKHVARRGKEPKVGDEVFCWGSPGDFFDLLRVGRVAGKAKMPEASEWPVLQYPALRLTGAFARGDSGAGVFNMQGELVGVISFGTMSHTFPPNLFTGMLPLRFTRAQWRAAK